MDREYFTVKLHSAAVPAATRIRLETRFAQLIEHQFGGHDAALQACRRAASHAQEDGAWKLACTQVTCAMQADAELPAGARFSICLSQVIDL
jgi:hypothetical protein